MEYWREITGLSALFRWKARWGCGKIGLVLMEFLVLLFLLLHEFVSLGRGQFMELVPHVFEFLSQRRERIAGLIIQIWKREGNFSVFGEFEISKTRVKKVGKENAGETKKCFEI